MASEYALGIDKPRALRYNCAMQTTHGSVVDHEIRALMEVTLRFLRYLTRWLERRYGLATSE